MAVRGNVNISAVLRGELSSHRDGGVLWSDATLRMRDLCVLSITSNGISFFFVAILKADKVP